MDYVLLVEVLQGYEDLGAGQEAINVCMNFDPTNMYLIEHEL